MILRRQQKQVLRMLKLGPVKNWKFRVNYILNPNARMSELKDKGVVIEKNHVTGGTWSYGLILAKQPMHIIDYLLFLDDPADLAGKTNIGADVTVGGTVLE